MRTDDLRVTDGGAAGAWIVPRLGDEEFGAVTLQVPKGYEAYARVFHPAFDLDGNPVRWAEVALAFGKTAHKEMQWHSLLGLSGPEHLAGSYGPDSAIGLRWTGQDPPTGEMDRSELDILCEILAAHTADSGHCYFGLSTIRNWLDSFSGDELKPLLRLPGGRDFIVLAGPLSAVDQLSRDGSKPSQSRAIFMASEGNATPSEPSQVDWNWREAPNLIWPADRSWLVAGEVDFDSTLVGGHARLIEAIVQSSELEAWQVEPTDSLAAYADKINR